MSIVEVKWAGKTDGTSTDASLSMPFSIIKPVKNSQPEVGQIHVGESWGDIKKQYATEWKDAPYIAFDFEATGLTIWKQEFMPVGVGLAWGNNRSCYISFKEKEHGKFRSVGAYIQGILKLNKPLIAHNMFYDGTILAKYNKGVFPEQALWCTKALARHLASENFKGQEWGLKWLMKNCLGWHDSNEANLMKWLVENGHTTTEQKKLPDKLSGWWQRSSDSKWCRPNKGDMWNAPDPILGHYCMLDSLGTLQLFEDVMAPQFELFPEYLEYYKGPFWRMLRRLSESHLQGINIDKRALASLWVELEQDMHSISQRFTQHPTVRPHIEAYNREKIAERIKKQPEAVTSKGEVSGNWKNWWTKLKEDERVQWFNIGSDDQLRWLFYDRLKMRTDKTPKTDTGQLSVGIKGLSLLGPLGKMIEEYREAEKLQGYVAAYLDKHVDTRGGASIVRPSWNVPGTLTGRQSSSNPNFQNVPKNRKFLSCFTPPPGKAWVDNDVNSLENVIAAEVTKDPVMLKVYEEGSEACAHCETAAKFPGLGEEVRKFYDPANPTAAGVKAVKANCKWLRDLGKKVNYSQVYGIGAKKLHSDLDLEGVEIDGKPITLEQAKEMWQSYWDTYVGLARYKARLLREWHMRGRWIRNVIGRPLAVAENDTKDLFSRSVQSGGHDILLIYVDCVEVVLNRAGIKNWRFLIPDYHDETMVECNKEDAEQVAALMNKEAYDELQKILGADIPHRGESAIGFSLVPFKLEEE